MLTVSYDPLHDVIFIFPLSSASTTTGDNHPSNQIAPALPENLHCMRHRDEQHTFTRDELSVKPDADDVQQDLSEEYSLHFQPTDTVMLRTTQAEITSVNAFVIFSSVLQIASVSPVRNMALPSFSALSAEALSSCSRCTKDNELAVNHMRAVIYVIFGSATKYLVYINRQLGS